MTRIPAELHAEALASGHPCDCPACAPELYRDDEDESVAVETRPGSRMIGPGKQVLSARASAELMARVEKVNRVEGGTP